MDLDQAVDELYAGPVAGFVDRRDALVREAKAGGDPGLAASVAALRRPTAGARLANILVRGHRAEVEELVSLGAALRDAQAGLDADQLKALGRQRQQVVQGLVGVAVEAAAELGERPGAAAAQELGATLTAALADPDAAEQLLSGRLTRPLAYAGLGFGEGAVAAGPTRGATAPRRAGSGKAASARPAEDAAGRAEAAARAARIDAAERDLVQARLQAAEAEAEADEVERLATEAEQAVAEASARLDEVRAEATRLEAELKEAKAVVARAAKARTAVARDVATAQRTAARASEALDALRATGA